MIADALYHGARGQLIIQFCAFVVFFIHSVIRTKWSPLGMGPRNPSGDRVRSATEARFAQPADGHVRSEARWLRRLKGAAMPLSFEGYLPSCLCVPFVPVLGQTDREGGREKSLTLSPVWPRDETHRGHHRSRGGMHDPAPPAQGRQGAARTPSLHAELIVRKRCASKPHRL